MDPSENNLTKLTDVMFEELDWLMTCKGEERADAIKHAKAVQGMASEIISAGNLMLHAVNVRAELRGNANAQAHMPKMLGGDEG